MAFASAGVRAQSATADPVSAEIPATDPLPSAPAIPATSPATGPAATPPAPGILTIDPATLSDSPTAVNGPVVQKPTSIRPPASARPLAGPVSTINQRPTTVMGCPLPLAIMAPPEPPSGPLPAGGAEALADRADYRDGGLSTLTGNVTLRQPGQEVQTGSAVYDAAQNLVTMPGATVLRTEAYTLESPGPGSYGLATQTGEFANARVFVKATGARTGAGLVLLTSPETTRLDTVTYTTCANPGRGWLLSAMRLDLDRTKGLGIARAAKLSIDGVPVLYLPYFQFPITDARQSGLLFPTFSRSTLVGFDFRQPVYLNLAPNYDAFITPRYMSLRGAQLGGKFRYLDDRTIGSFNGEWLPHDQVTGKTRSLFQWNHDGVINPRLAASVRYGAVSDSAYFEDLGVRPEYAALTYLERTAVLTYQAPGAYRAELVAQDFQVISSDATPADNPYRRSPELRVEALTRNELNGFSVGANGAATYFTRSVPGSAEGLRAWVVPSIRYGLDHVDWYLNSDVDTHITRYQLSTAPDGIDDSATRIVPRASLETGVRFARRGGDASLQTLEPRLFVLYSAYRDQSRLPVFDTDRPELDDLNLFARNRYVGQDRIADDRLVALAVTTRRIEADTGIERFNATFGQAWRLQDSRVGLPGESPDILGASEWVGQATYALSRRVAANAAMRFNPETHQFERGLASLDYRDGRTRASVTYRYRQGLLEQVDWLAAVPISESWRLAARQRFSVPQSQTLDIFAGVEYENCCTIVRTTVRRYLANTRGQYASGLFVQFLLKGLGRFGTGTASGFDF